MSDRATPFDEERPRFLLPEGCRDLIDTLRPPKAEPKLMYVYDGAGQSLGPPLEIPETDSVPRGLSAIPRYVARLLQNPKRTSTLSITVQGWLRVVTLVRREGQIELHYLYEAGLAPECEALVRAFARRRQLPRGPNYPMGNTSMHCLVYRLPSGPGIVSGLCRALLAECFGIQPNDRLEFDLFAFD